MGRSRSLGKNVHALLALLFILANLATPAAFADEQVDTADVLISVFNCPYDPGNVTVTAGTIPSDCTPAIGITMSIQADTPDGTTTCLTTENGVCWIQVVNGTAVTVWEDTSLLSGAVPRQNPVGVSAVLDYTELTFINVVPTPTPVPTDVPPAEPTAMPTDVPPPTVPPTPEPTQPVTPQRSLIQSQTQDTTSQISDTATNTPTATATATATNTPTATATATNTPTATASATNTPTATATATITPTATATATYTPTATATATNTPTVTPTNTPVTKTYATVSGTYGAGLRCRADANTSAPIITVLAEGTKVETRGAESGGWIPVTCAGQAGWIYAGYATTSTETSTPGTSTPTTGTAKIVNTDGAGLRCRAGASTLAAIITVLSEGSTVETRGAESGGWVPVKCAGQDGWIYGAYASVSTTPTSNPTPSPTKVPTDPVSGETGYGYVRNTGGGGLNCRASASLSGNVITILAEGAKVETRGSASGDWVPVKCAGQDGWVYKSYFVISTSGSAPTPAPTQAPTPAPGTSKTVMVFGTGGGGLNCRTSPSLSASVITIVPEGASLTSRGAESGGWLPVTCAGQAGWVSSAYLLIDGSGGSSTLWIDVNLSRQYMKVYRGNTVIAETYVSTGRYGFETPPGVFYVNWKLPSQTMTGVLGGEYYYVPDVPWVMYFTNYGHAIHGAYWHNNFGYPMSHGCVNLPVDFAAWLYSITPVGTKVNIHY